MTFTRGLIGLVAAAVALALLLVGEAVVAARGAGDEVFRNPSREPMRFGRGPRLVYAVLGDSTGAGQGAPYERGIAVGTARGLARGRAVELSNLSVSGATTAEVLRDQAAAAARLRADVVLVAAGANDVTHLTRPRRLRASLRALVDRLRAARCDTRIVLTASPEMGVVPRFAEPLRSVAGLATRRVNRVFFRVARERAVTVAPIAREAGPPFERDPSLFAPDRFHPDARGYAVWVPVLERALAEARRQPSRCPGGEERRRVGLRRHGARAMMAV